AALRHAGVPIAPNRRVSASGSINTWIAHGRRPLVPDSAYSRELRRRSPGAVTLYDADSPGSLGRAIEAALADPSRTMLAPGTPLGPTVEEVGRLYRRHFAGCAPARALPVDDRRWVVPGNRWDLLAGREPAEPPSVSVVIPYFEAQDRLDLVLAALSRQTHPASRLQIVVADDGSSVPPSVAAAQTLDTVVVRQSRDGFRAAAARNLGAAAAAGEVVVFLDGDTVPEPGFVSHLSRLPALTTDAVTVGRRRHADLAGWTPLALERWWDGSGPSPAELPEPGWLVDAYAETTDLLEGDHRSHRFLISAVLAMSRDLFTELSGFDERFRAYGGEDWELGHRAYVAGAVLAHVPEAVAWHDGPDWAGRTASGDPSAKNLETLTLTALLPDPEARGGGQWRLPAIAVELGFSDAAEVLATSRAAFAGDADTGVWVDHPEAAAVVRVLDDPRIQAGPVPREVLERARALLRLDAPARVTGLMRMAERADAYGPLTLPSGRFAPRRVARRSARWASSLGLDPDIVESLLFGGRDLPSPLPSHPVDLAHELKHVRGESAQDVSRS
ncbi:MAG: glycosyltransferase, partial [Lapillicoccus sp.]